jgi:hypothetical protein
VLPLWLASIPIEGLEVADALPPEALAEALPPLAEFTTELWLTTVFLTLALDEAEEWEAAIEEEEEADDGPSPFPGFVA